MNTTNQATSPTAIETPADSIDTIALLEQRIAERTAQLSAANTQLRAEIAERAEIEQTLRTTLSLLEEAERQADLGSWSFDVRSAKGWWSQHMYRLFNCDPANGVPHNSIYIHLIHPEDRGILIQTLSDMEQGRAPEAIPFRTNPEYGPLRVLQPQYRIEHDQQGQIVRFVGTILNITNQALVQEALKTSEQRFKNVIDFALDAIISTDAEQRITLYNNAAERMFGYSAAEALGKPLDALLPERFRRAHQRLVQAFGAQAHGAPGTSRQAVIGVRANGEEFPCEVSISAITNEQQLSYTAIIRDVSERQRAEDARRKSEALLSEAQRIGRIGHWEWTAPGRTLTCSDEMFNILNIPKEQNTISQQMLIAMLEPAEQQRLLALDQQAFANRSDLDYEYHLNLPDGNTRWIHQHARITYDDLGTPIRMMGIMQDVTRRKQIELDAQQREALLVKVIGLGKNITAINDLGRCLFEIYQSIRYGLGIDRVALYLYDHTTRMIQGTYGTTRTGEIEEISWFHQDVSRWRMWHQALESPRGIGMLEDFTTFNQLLPDHEMYGVRQHALLSAWVGETPVAMLAIDNLITQRVISPAELEALQLFAGYIGLAIANARLHTNLEQRIRERTAEVQDLYDHAPNGYHSLDADGVFVLVNQTELNWLGYSRAELIGVRRFRDLLTPASQPAFDQAFLQCKEQGTVHGLELDICDKHGEILPVLVNASSIYDAAGNIIQCRATLFDITERRKVERALRESRDELRAANHALQQAARLKDEFLANMSHELRTPLNAILAFSESLLEQYRGPLNERQELALRHIEASGRHLLELINDILDLSKVEAGQLELHLEPVSIADVCQASMPFVKEAASKKAIRLGFYLNDHLAIMEADSKRLKQMLVNLLSNAVKFTPSNGAVSLEAIVDPNTETVCFVVEDTGIGIAAADVTRLFQPFTQLDSSLSRQHEGTGLGLALVRRLAELHGGSVQVESSLGKGSKFTITIPYRKPVQVRPSETIGDIIAPPAILPLRPVRILLVEDNEINIIAIQEELIARGYQVMTANNGREALERAHNIPPDLILMDIQLPEIDGLEATRRLRAQASFAHTPIIALTALAMPGDRERCLAAGANEYLMKPISLKELLRVIERYQRRS